MWIQTLKGILFLLFLSSIAFAAIEKPSAKKEEPISFSLWKQKKIRAAHQRYEEALASYQEAKKASVVEKRDTHQKSKTAYQVLQYSRKLSINDYFEMYLAEKFPNDISALNTAMGHMSRDQIRQLLASYQKRLRDYELKHYEN